MSTRDQKHKCPEPPKGTRLVLMTEELAVSLGADRVEWGQPDEHGWYTPTLFRGTTDHRETLDVDDMRGCRRYVSGGVIVCKSHRNLADCRAVYGKRRRPKTFDDLRALGLLEPQYPRSVR